MLVEARNMFVSNRMDSSQLYPSTREVFQFLLPVHGMYPGFEGWFEKTFVAGMKSGERQIFSNFDDGRLVAVALLKASKLESKICTLYVCPSRRGLGYGTNLISQSLDWFGELSKPCISVGAERVEDLAPLLFAHSFSLTDCKDGFYRAGIKEFFFSAT